MNVFNYLLTQKISTDLFICANENEAQETFSALDFCFSNVASLRDYKDILPALISIPKPFLLPDLRFVYGDDLRTFRDDLLQTFNVLSKFYSYTKSKILISPIHSILYPLPKQELLNIFTLKHAQKITQTDFVTILEQMGYEAVIVVEMAGEFSQRGDVIDICLPSEDEEAYRICFFDDEVESIRAFDISTQLSVKIELGELLIPPALWCEDVELSKDIKDAGFVNEFWNLGDRAAFLTQTLKAFMSEGALKEMQEIYALDYDSRMIEKEKLENLPILQDIALDSKHSTYENTSAKFDNIDFTASSFIPLLSLYKDARIILITPTFSALKPLGLDFVEQSLRIIDVRAFASIDISRIQVIQGSQKINVASQKLLILSLNFAFKKPHRKRARLHLNELVVGEYVVHSDYGIGKFLGLTKTKVNGVESEFLLLAYQGEDRLLLPVDRLDLLSRYVADSGDLPIVDRLGKASFARLKSSIKVKLFEIAKELMNVAAARALIRGERIDTSDVEKTYAMHQFRANCGFSLTSDQEQSIQEISQDLASSKVMDRLLSGDVGFGKTEVAMHAMYACFLCGFQSIILAPTTLLSAQHFHSLQKRFENLDKIPRVARLDRFSSSAQLYKQVEQGHIDIVVGTHALLDARFKNLALVIIDEEHKFGVKQKERIKQFCNFVHILSMSATPIPRTLNMALSHIKPISSLRTPPLDRKGVRTFLKDFHPNFVKEAINRELRRDGQVFYIHNMIASIEDKKRELLELLPNLRIAILHSKISNDKSQSIMQDFLGGKVDVLLSTSIVESGLHLPNANTIIIEHANHFGIADLHQLRGRVGRGDREGFCFLFVKDIKTLHENARKRLYALEKNSYLGSGENLAYHDLEIRGGGNLIGQAQSGHIKKVGYGLYLSLLEECINELSTQGVKNKEQVDLKLQISAYLDSELVSNPNLRLELYRRLSDAKGMGEVEEIEQEIENRFGRLDACTLRFLELVRVRVGANMMGLKQIMRYEQKITFVDKNNERQTISAPSKNADDILSTTLGVIKEMIKKH